MSAVFNFTFVPWFRSVAPYIHMHRGKTFVVAVAGEAIAAGKLQNLAQDLARGFLCAVQCHLVGDAHAV